MEVHDFDGAYCVERDEELLARLRSVRRGADGAFILDHGGGGSIAFNRDAYAIVMPNERVLTTAGGSPRWYKDAKTWASAVDEAMAAQAWFDAGQSTVGGEQ